MAGKVPWRLEKVRSKAVMRPEDVQVMPVQVPLQGSVPLNQALEVVRPEADQLEAVTEALMESRPLV